MPTKRRQLNLPTRSSSKRKNKKKKKPRYIKMTRRLGVDTKCTEAVIDECVELLKEGLPIARACDYIGITSDSYHEWKHRGEKFLREIASGVKPEYPEYEIYGLFVQEVVRAKAQWQLEILRRSMQADSPHRSMWIRDMTLLERRDRQHWGRSESISPVDSAPMPDESYL